MQDVLAQAVEMHRAGQLCPAAELYQQVLAREPESVQALHLLGVLRHQQGEHAQAIEFMGRAVALRPNAYVIHANLAEAYRGRGEFERAAGCCRMALGLNPDYPDALCNLGAALQALGRHDEAIEHFQHALRVQPDFATVHNNLGIALRERGEPEKALRHFRRAVELDPNFASARTNLGLLLLDRSQADEALEHCREAVRLQPNVAALQHNLGNVLRALGKLVEARAAYLEALRLEPKLALSKAHLGLVLRREGELDNALPWLKQAVELEPRNATFWEYLAELHDELEEPAHSLPCWQQVVTLAPAQASGHLALGWALQEEGRLAEAGEHYRTAAQLRPDIALAPMNLGGLQEELGDMAAAEASFRDALRLQPAFALPYARIATLLRGKMSAEDQDALEERLKDEQLARGPRARLLFALAHVLDARGDYARAADCLREGNAMTLETNKGRRDYSPADHEKFVDGLVGRFDCEFFARLRGAGSHSRRPVFIVGLPRSGTTLIEQVLASHSHIHGAGELRLARQSFETLPAILGRGGPPRDCLPHLDAPAAERLAEQHLDRLQAIDGDRCERIVDKMPDNYLYLGLLAAMFPRAVFIHCRRDLRDVAVSCWMTDFRSIRWANDPEHLATRFQQYRRVMDHWGRVLPVTVQEVAYEEAVGDLEAVARRLIAACGLEWEPTCMEFHRTSRPVRTASVVQVRQPVYRRSLERWKNYETAMAKLFARLPAG